MRIWVSIASPPKNASLLQSVDDLLIAANTMVGCKAATEELLKTLGRLGYHVSAKKVQLCELK